MATDAVTHIGSIRLTPCHHDTVPPSAATEVASERLVGLDAERFAGCFDGGANLAGDGLPVLAEQLYRVADGFPDGVGSLGDFKPRNLALEKEESPCRS